MSNPMKTKNLNIKQIIDLVPRDYREETLRRNTSGRKKTPTIVKAVYFIPAIRMVNIKK